MAQSSKLSKIWRRFMPPRGGSKINKLKSSDIATYYDDWTERYELAGGKIIEAFRPKSDDELISYYIEKLQLRPGLNLIDAGCGLGWPSILIAKRLDVSIEAITNSAVQAEKANSLILEHGLEGRVRVTLGDYNELDKYFGPEHDRIFFLESYGHSLDKIKTITSAAGTLREGGLIYIKDFFLRSSKNAETERAVRHAERRVNENYCYSTPCLSKTVEYLLKNEFIIEHLATPSFIPDAAIRVKFETDNEIDNYGPYGVFPFAVWYDIVGRLESEIVIPGLSA